MFPESGRSREPAAAWTVYPPAAVSQPCVAVFQKLSGWSGAPPSTVSGRQREVQLRGGGHGSRLVVNRWLLGVGADKVRGHGASR